MEIKLSAFFHGREKTSFPMGSRLWLGGEEGRPGARDRHSAGGKCSPWAEDLMATGDTSSGNRISSSRHVVYL